MKRLFTIVAAVSVGAVQAAEFVAGNGDVVTNTIPAGEQVLQTERLLTGEGASIYKLGEGLWTIPDTVVSGHFLPLSISVLEGGVALKTGATVAPGNPCPTELMNTAKFWFDASKRETMAIERSGDKDFVNFWYDVRETDRAAPRHIYCEAMHDCLDAASKQPGLSPELTQVDGVDALWFGGLASGRYLLHRLPDGSMEDMNKTASLNIKAVFAVHAVKKSFGFIFGNRPLTGSGGRSSFPISDYSSATSWGTYLASWEIVPNGYEVFNARTFLDGRQIDPCVTKPSAGLQLYEVDLGRGAESMQTFFNDCNRNSDEQYVCYRQGGDYLCEVVAFTNALTEAERLKVEAYLMQKWMPAKMTAGTNVRLGKGAVAVVDTEGRDTRVAMGASGDGMMEILGTGAVAFDDELLKGGQTMRVRPVANGGRITTAKPLSLALQGGEVATVESYYYNRGGNVDQGISEVRTTVTGGAPAGRIIKRGDEDLELSSVPKDVTRLTIEEGSLTLRASQPQLEGSAADFVAVPNHSFEEGMDGADNRDFASGSQQGGWTFTADGFSKMLIFKSGGLYASNGWCLQDVAPDGDYALFLKDNANASTSVEIPRPGLYELSLAIGGRTDGFYSRGYGLDVSFEGAGGKIAAGRVMAVVDAKIGNWIDHRYQRRLLRVRFASAGTYTLKLQHAKTYAVDNWYNDRECCVDDIHLRRLPEVDPEKDAWPLPNGDFESAQFPENRTTPPYSSEVEFSTETTVEGWTISSSGAAFTTRCSTLPVNYNDSRYPAGGEVELCFRQNAQVTTTFTPPAGTWQLRADMAKLSTDKCALSAKVRIGGVWKELSGSSVLPTSILFDSYTWPTTFTVDGNTPVELALDFQSPGGNVGIYADNLRLVPVDASEGSELVYNGDFEANSSGWPYGWTPTDTKIGWATGYPQISKSLDEHWGYGKPHGLNYVSICEDQTISQTLTFAPGTYRFSMLARTRHDVWGKVWGLNPIRVELCDPASGAPQQIIGEVLPKGTNFVEYAWNFRVDSEGQRNLLLRGMSHEQNGGPSTLVDLISVKKIGDAPTYPDLPETLRLNVAAGSKVQLDFTGTQTVDRVILGGQRQFGVIDAQRFPRQVFGPGALFAEHKLGLTLILY